MSTRYTRPLVLSGRWAQMTQFGILAAAAAAATVLTAALVGAGQAPSADSLEIEQVVRGALTAKMTLEVPPADYHAGSMSNVQQTAMLNNVDTLINRFYAAGRTRDYLVQALHRNIAADADGHNRYIAGGVDWVRFQEVTISGLDAQVHAQAQLWNRQAVDGGNGPGAEANPRAVVDYTASLHKETAGWRIVTERLQIVSGDRP